MNFAPPGVLDFPSTGMEEDTMAGGPFFDHPTELGEHSVYYSSQEKSDMDIDSFTLEEAGEKSMPGKQHNLLEAPHNEPTIISDTESIFPVSGVSVGHSHAILTSKTDKCCYIEPPGTPDVWIPQGSAPSTPIISSTNDSNQLNLTCPPNNRTPPRSGLSEKIGTDGLPILSSIDLSATFSVEPTGSSAGIGYEQQVSGAPSQESVTIVGLPPSHI